MRRFGRLRDERGQASIEFTGLLPYLLLAAVFGWQVLLITTTINSAENAARAGSRVAGMGGNGDSAATEALPPWLRDHRVAPLPGGGCGGGGGSTAVTVCLEIPVLFPGVGFDEFQISRSAEFPTIDIN